MSTLRISPPAPQSCFYVLFVPEGSRRRSLPCAGTGPGCFVRAHFWCAAHSPRQFCGLVHQFLASLIQLAIFLGQLVRRIVHQFAAALVQVFAPLGEFLAGLDNVICSILSFTVKSAACSRTGPRRHQQRDSCTDRGSQQEECYPVSSACVLHECLRSRMRVSSSQAYCYSAATYRAIPMIIVSSFPEYQYTIRVVARLHQDAERVREAQDEFRCGRRRRSFRSRRRALIRTAETSITPV